MEHHGQGDGGAPVEEQCTLSAHRIPVRKRANEHVHVRSAVRTSPASSVTLTAIRTFAKLAVSAAAYRGYTILTMATLYLHSTSLPLTTATLAERTAAD